MERSPKSPFESAWRDSFEHAESSPSADLWDRVERDIAVNENSQLKRSLYYTRWLAAAAISLVALSGVYWYGESTSNNDSIANTLALNNTEQSRDYIPSENRTDNLVEEENRVIPAKREEQAAGVSDNEESSKVLLDTNTRKSIPGDEPKKDVSNSLALNERPSESTSGPIAGSEGRNTNVSGVNGREERRVGAEGLEDPSRATNALAIDDTGKDGQNSRIMGENTSEWAVAEPQNLTDESGSSNMVQRGASSDAESIPAFLQGYGITDYSLASSPEMETVYQWDIDFSEEDNFDRGYWAGLAVGGGNYNSTGLGGSFSQTESLASLDQAGALDRSNERSSLDGMIQGVGVNLGARMSKRFSINSGMQYSSIQSGYYEGNNTMISSATLSSAKQTFSTASSQDPAYLQEDRFHFVNVPAQIGFHIIDKKLGWTVFSGVDSRIHLGTSRQEYIQGTNSYTPQERSIRPLTFWGGMSSELSYKFLDNYQVSLSAGYKMAINSLEENTNELPSLTELGISMRYRFN